MTDVYTVYMGDQLGLYRALADGDATEAGIAEAAEIDRRYLREWLEQQAVTGLIEVDDAASPRTSGATGSPTATPRSSWIATTRATWPPSPA